MAENRRHSGRLAAVALSTFVAASHGAAAADDCDPEKILRDNVTKIEMDDETLLSLSQSNERDTAKSAEDKLSGKYDFDELDIESRRNFTDKIRRQLNFNYEVRQKRSLFESSLSAASVEAYKACLGARPMRIEFAGAPTRAKNFGVKITWNPPPGSALAGNLVVRTRNGRIELLSGEAGSVVTQAGAYVATVRIIKGSTAQFEIYDRDVWAETEITAEVQTPTGNFPAEPSLYIPPRIQDFVIDKGTVFSAAPLVRSRSAVKTTTVCVEPDSPTSSLVLAESVWQPLKQIPPGRRDRSDFLPLSGNDDIICGTMMANGSKRKGEPKLAETQGRIAARQLTPRLLPKTP